MIDHFDFHSSDVRLLLDDEATKTNILEALEDLIAEALTGDVLVFTNSSHGTYLADTSGDEETYDEAMCPYDCADNLIVDDELREIFAKLPKKTSLTVVSDSCFSGTVTRAAVAENIPGLRTPDDRRVRFLNPALLGKNVLENPWKAAPKGKAKHPESKMKEVLLSGCTDKEYSYDALIEGKYHGAMTYFALRAIQDADYDITFQQLQTRMLVLLEEGDYPQHPQLEGKKTSKRKKMFV
jgi:hypothetical protein